MFECLSVHHVQIHIPTASTEWARRAHSVFVRLACVNHGQIHYPTPSIVWARRAYAELVRFACIHHCKIHDPSPSTECLNGSVFKLFSYSHLYPVSGLRSPWPDQIPYSKLQNHFTILRACIHIQCLSGLLAFIIARYVR